MECIGTGYSVGSRRSPVGYIVCWSAVELVHNPDVGWLSDVEEESMASLGVNS